MNFISAISQSLDALINLVIFRCDYNSLVMSLLSMLASVFIPSPLSSLLPPAPQVLQWISRWSWRTRGHSSNGEAPSRGCRNPTSSSRSPRSPTWSPRRTTAHGSVTGHVCVCCNKMKRISLRRDNVTEFNTFYWDLKQPVKTCSNMLKRTFLEMENFLYTQI